MKSTAPPFTAYSIAFWNSFSFRLTWVGRNWLAGISVSLKEVKECVEKAGIPLETAISTITANPAEILSLKGKGKIQEGFDADLCVLDQGLEIQEVVARGKTVYRK